MNKNPFPLAVTTNPIVQIEDDSVLSNNFNDIYFQPNNGLEEKNTFSLMEITYLRTGKKSLYLQLPKPDLELD